MAKSKNPPVFGNNLQEVDQNISAMNAEREQLAQKQGTKDFDNKRFEELTNNLVAANQQRSSLSPVDSGTSQPFNVQTTTVPPVQTGLPSTTQTVFGQQASTEDSLSGPLAGDITPGQEVIGAQSMMDQTAQPTLPGNDVSLMTSGNMLPGANQPVQMPQGGTNGIVQSVLGNVDRSKNDGISNAINSSIFGQPSSYKQDPSVDMTANDLFFASNEPIQKGSVSGQIIGNQPIFVGGADYFPTQVLMRRQKAIQDAAIAQKQTEQEFLNQRAPMIKDKGFQQSLNSMFNDQFGSVVNEAKSKYGENWLNAIKDQSTDVGQKYVNFADNMDFIAGSADQVTDNIAEVRAGVETGDLIYSDETLNLMDDYEKMQNQFAGGDVNSLVNLRKEFGQLEGHIGIDKVLNDQGIDIKGTVTQTASVIDKGDYYETTEQKKTAYEDQLRVIANDLANQQLRSSVRGGLVTEEDIFNHLNALYGYEKITNKSISQKPTGSGAITINLDQPPVVTDTPVLDSQWNSLNMVYKREIPTAGKPMEVSGASYYDKNGNLVREKGVVDINPNAVGVAEFTVKNPDGTTKTVYKKGVVGTYTEPEVRDPEGKVVQPAVTKTKVYSWDELNKRFQADNPGNADTFEKTDQEMNSVIKQKENQPPPVNMAGNGQVR